MARVSTGRSQFIEKLHSLLESPFDDTSLRWVGDDAFEITCHDGRARNALSPSWDFRSLSSFIRQLSYYNFKRLSDRRKSTERRSNTVGYIVFAHPSGAFVRGDASRLSEIVRKTRARPEKTNPLRRASASASASSSVVSPPDAADEASESPPGPAPQWALPERQLFQAGENTSQERRLHHYTSVPNFTPSYREQDLHFADGHNWRGEAIRPQAQPQQQLGWNDGEFEKRVLQQEQQRRMTGYGTMPGSPPTKRIDAATARGVAGALAHAGFPHDDLRAQYPSAQFNPTNYGLGSSTIPRGIGHPSPGSIPYDVTSAYADYQHPQSSLVPSTSTSGGANHSSPADSANAPGSTTTTSPDLHEAHLPFNPTQSPRQQQTHSLPITQHVRPPPDQNDPRQMNISQSYPQASAHTLHYFGQPAPWSKTAGEGGNFLPSNLTTEQRSCK